MKKLSIVLGFCFVMLFCVVVSAAEYVVKEGDCLSVIAVDTNHSVQDLINLNGIDKPNWIFQGQRVNYITEKDLENAKAWAEKRRVELRFSDDNYRYFGWIIRDITIGNIRYSVNQTSGVHASLILAFSEAWKKLEKQ